jgi:periplasmic divalent cation tolerance protein
MVVLSTAPSKKTGREIAREIVSAGLAACVNIVPGLVSIYEWDGRLEESDEVLLLIKTSRERVETVVEKITSLHPYEVPEVIALPIEAGHQPYLEWIDSIVSSSRGKEGRTK